MYIQLTAHNIGMETVGIVFIVCLPLALIIQ